MSHRHARAAALGLAALVLGAAARPTTTDAIDLGRGPNGEICAAERAWADPLAPGLFDRAFTLNCRGWTETPSAGRLLRVRDDAAARAALAAGRNQRLLCGAPRKVAIVGLGPVEARQCREQGNRPVLTLTLARGGKLLAGEAIGQFGGNLAVGLGALAGVTVAMSPIDLRALPNAPIGGAGTALTADEFGDRSLELRQLAVVGDYGDADELARPALNAPPRDAGGRTTFHVYLEGALARSNLGDDAGAQALLAKSRATLSASPTLATDRQEGARLHVYEGLRALDARDYAAAESAADALDALHDAPVAPTSATVLANPAAVGRLNERPAGRSGRANFAQDAGWLTDSVLEAEARFIRGSAFAARRRDTEAETALASAAESLAAVDSGEARQDNTRSRWLASSIASIRATVAERDGDLGRARAQRELAYRRLADVPAYAETPLLARRTAEYAGFLARHGDAGAAKPLYVRAFAIMDSLGPSASAGMRDLSPYFDLLAVDASGDGAAAEAGRAEFFKAAQFVTPSSSGRLAETMRRQFESGNTQTAVRKKTLDDVERERRRIGTQLATTDDKDPARAGKLAELASRDKQAAALREELGGDLVYQKVADTAATLTELRAALRPGEGYYKLLSLPDASYGILVTGNVTRVFKIAVQPPVLARGVAAVRQSIDGNVVNGRVYPRPYEVRRAFGIDVALFGPVRGEIAALKSLVIEPSGSMTQLPFGVLVVDAQSVDWWAAHRASNPDNYTGVHFLASAIDLSTSLSPRAFIAARGQKASRAAHAYIGFGEHRPTQDAADLALLPARIGSTCPARAAELEAAFKNTRAISGEELDIAGRLLGGGPVLKGPAFTDTAVEARGDPQGDLKDYAVIHFATHGLKEGELGCNNEPALLTTFDAANPASHGLLRYTDIAKLALNANVVVLSACNTASEVSARQDLASGEQVSVGAAATLNGLVRAFFLAGSRAVLTTHWAIPVSFEAGSVVRNPSRDLMSSLFGHAASGDTTSAIRAAQTELAQRVETSHPYYWGAFAVVGDGSRAMTERAQ